MKYILLFVLTILFLLNGCQQFEVKDKNAEMQKLTNENKELREYIKNLRDMPRSIGIEHMALHLNMENPITITMPGFLKEEISITVENGTYREDKGRWYIRPASADKEIVITVYALIDGKSVMIFQRYFLVKPVSLSAYILLSENKKIIDFLSENQLDSVKSVMARWDDFPQAPLKAQSFSMAYFDSKKNSLLKERTTGNEFSEIQQKILTRLKKGDIIYITDIIVIGPDGVERELSPMEILIRK